MFIIIRSIYFFRNGFEKNLSFIDKFLTISDSRFNLFQNKIHNKFIKFNCYKKKININNIIKNKYLKYLFSFKYIKKNKKIKISLKSIFIFLKFYIKSLKFMYYSINIDIDIDDSRYNKLNTIFNLLELDSKNLIKNLLDEKNFTHYLNKNLKTNKIIFNTKQSLYKKIVKNITCFFISETNICDQTNTLSDICNKTYVLYNNIYNSFRFKVILLENKFIFNINLVNIFFNLKKHIILNLNFDLLYTNIFNYLDILPFKPFIYSESKIMLFCLSIFFELIYICFSYIAFFNIEFINIIQTCLDLINLYKLEIFSFLEFMCIKTFKKDYFIYHLLILSIIRQFLNDNNFLINFFYKYYNTYSFDIIKYIYSCNFSEIIEIFRSSYHMNTFLNSINVSITFVKKNFNDFMLVTNNIYPLNKFLNLNYYFKFFIYKFNNIFIKALIYYNNKSIFNKNNINSDDNLDLIRQTPLKFKVSIENLSETIQNSSKRGRPRKLTIYQKGVLIEEGFLKPLKPLTEKQLFENKFGVSYEFAQKNLFDYILKREQNYKKKEQKIYIKKISGGENYYIKTNIKDFSNEPIVFSEKNIKAALSFASELMLEFDRQDSVKLKRLKNNKKKKKSGRPCKNSIRTIKIYVSIGRLKSRKYYTENLIKN